MLISGAYIAGRWQTGRTHSEKAMELSPAPSRKILRYICPMHPQYTSDHPGDAPCCGMRMEPVYADSGSAASPTLPATSFPVNLEKQEILGIRFETAEITPGTQRIRTGARVAYDQRETVLVADVYEYEAPALQIGQQARVSRPYPPRREFWATVDFLYPRLDPTSRTLKVRLNAGDIGVKLIPDTFLNVEFIVKGRPALTVPSEAVLNTGLRSVVFVDLGNGSIEPREVETGRRLGSRLEILRGLQRGDRVAATGTFMLDSESRIRMPNRDKYADASDHGRIASEAPRVNAATGMPMQMDQPSNAPFRNASKMVTDSNPLQTDSTVQLDPVCGMEVDTMLAGLRKSTYAGKTYYFCSTECKRKFDANPSAYVKPAAPRDESGKQPHAHPMHMDETQQEPEASEAGASPSLPIQAGPAGEPWYSALAQTGVKHLDPVCGKSVDEKNARVRLGVGRSLVREYEGRLFYFCSIECKREFDMNPEFYGRRALEKLESGNPATNPAVRTKAK